MSATVLSELNVVWLTPQSSFDLFAMGHGLCANKKGALLWNIASLVACWAIWLDSNNRIFESGIEGQWRLCGIKSSFG